MIYKYTKCESVIAKIFADLDASEKRNRITDIREWIFEAIEKIGAPMQYLTKESAPIKICDYQIPLPDDLHDLNGIAWSLDKNGPWVPMRTNSNTFKEHTPIYHNNCCLPNMRYKLPTVQAQFYTENATSYYTKKYGDMRFEDPMYFIKPGWITTNKKDGYIKLAYKAVATDERGYPLIPDLSSYQEALYWYVVMKLKFPKFLNGSLGGHRKYNMNVYTYLQQQWNFYRNQAYAEAMMPTEGDMRSIKNEWNKLIPEWDSDDTLFENLGSRQLNYNDYYYGR